jgi:anti-sigma regulatory factor (Ser/Thr protein kinase)
MLRCDPIADLMTDEAQQTTDSVKLVVPSHPKFLHVVRSTLYSLVTEAGFPKKDARKIVLAVDEACSNIIKYAYEGGHSGTIALTVTVGPDKLVVVLKDEGKKPDVAAIAPRRLDDIRPGGLGTFFMAAAFDKVEYDTSGPAGTVLTLIKERR